MCRRNIPLCTWAWRKMLAPLKSSLCSFYAYIPHKVVLRTEARFRMSLGDLGSPRTLHVLVPRISDHVESTTYTPRKLSRSAQHTLSRKGWTSRVAQPRTEVRFRMSPSMRHLSFIPHTLDRNVCRASQSYRLPTTRRAQPVSPGRTIVDQKIHSTSA